MMLMGILESAVECDKQGRFWQARHLYEEGVKIIKSLTLNLYSEKNKHLSEACDEYTTRANQIIQYIDKCIQSAKLVDHTKIDEHSRGYSYEHIFGRCLNDDVEEVMINEPNLSTQTEFEHFVKLLEVLRKYCPNLKYIQLTTWRNKDNQEYQDTALFTIKNNLFEHGVLFKSLFNKLLDEGQIVFNNGHIIRSKQGIHYYQQPPGDYTVGKHDFDCRLCVHSNILFFKVSDALRIKRRRRRRKI